MIMPALKREPRSTDRMLLILDLDETLIHAREEPLGRPADFRLFDFHVYRRPMLDDFIARAAAHYDLAVWSSASDDYVEAVVEHIFPDLAALQFVWGRSRATHRRGAWDNNGYMSDHRHYLKPLQKVRRLGWNLDRVLIIDDTPEKCARNFGNAIYPSPYEGDPADRELELLAAYLENLRDVPNVRRIEKRSWRNCLSER